MERALTIAREDGKWYRVSYVLGQQAFASVVAGRPAEAEERFAAGRAANPSYRDTLLPDSRDHGGVAARPPRRRGRQRAATSSTGRAARRARGGWASRSRRSRPPRSARSTRRTAWTRDERGVPGPAVLVPRASSPTGATAVVARGPGRRRRRAAPWLTDSPRRAGRRARSGLFGRFAAFDLAELAVEHGDARGRRRSRAAAVRALGPTDVRSRSQALRRRRGWRGGGSSTAMPDAARPRSTAPGRRSRRGLAAVRGRAPRRSGPRASARTRPAGGRRGRSSRRSSSSTAMRRDRSRGGARRGASTGSAPPGGARADCGRRDRRRSRSVSGRSPRSRPRGSRPGRSASACSSASGPSRPTSPTPTPSSACAPGSSWPAWRPTSVSERPRTPRHERRISVLRISVPDLRTGPDVAGGRISVPSSREDHPDPHEEEITMTTHRDHPGQVLDDELIERCGARAAGYDRDNTFFTEDFEELRASGYLLDGRADRARRPRLHARRGRAGRRAASRAAAPATALATNMHVYWTGRRRRPLPQPATARSCGCSKRPSPARCSPPVTARPATTSPC